MLSQSHADLLIAPCPLSCIVMTSRGAKQCHFSCTDAVHLRLVACSSHVGNPAKFRTVWLCLTITICLIPAPITRSVVGIQPKSAMWQCSIAQVLKNHNTKWEVTKGEKLTPVLAVGSNAAPTQLARKFPAEMFPDGVVIPVLRCVLPDFDVVYAPLISSYGSCTGMCSLTLPHCVTMAATTKRPIYRMESNECCSECRVVGTQLVESYLGPLVSLPVHALQGKP